MFKWHTVHCSNREAMSPHPHQLLCALIRFPCSQLHFCFVPPLHSCHTSSTPTLVMTPSLCYTVGHFRPPANYNCILRVVYTTHQYGMQHSRHWNLSFAVQHLSNCPHPHTDMHKNTVKIMDVQPSMRYLYIQLARLSSLCMLVKEVCCYNSQLWTGTVAS